MILRVFRQNMLLTVEPAGPVDGALSNGKDGALIFKKKLEFISWTLNIGKYRLWLVGPSLLYFSMNNSKYPDDEIVDDIEFCAGRPDLNGNGLTQEGETVCQGDSGGPLICNDNGRPVVYGVTSWLEDCGLAGFPSIFAKVASELDWIKEQL